MLYKATIRTDNSFGFVIGGDPASVISEARFAARELGAWSGDFLVEQIHEAVVPIFPQHPMKVRFAVRTDTVVVRGLAVTVPDPNGGDLFVFDPTAWIEFLKGWSPDGDWELQDLEVSRFPSISASDAED